MWSWLRNLVATKPPRDPSYTELLSAWVDLQQEWTSFLEQQARVSRRAAKRVRDDTQAPPESNDVPITNDKAVIRQRAISKGMFRHNGGANG